jgi:serine/threonine protein kinase
MAIPKSFSTLTAEYTRTGVIGEGGAAHVIEVQCDDGEIYALKLVNKHRATTNSLRRFRNELNYCKTERHPSIIRVLDEGFVHDDMGKWPFYVMPRYQETLRDLINRGIAEDKVLMYFRQMCEGLHAAHMDEVVHRDIKPDNILFDEQRDRLVIADFGIARLQQDDLLIAVKTKKADRLANFRYAAPEQRESGRPVDSRADIWALGLILNEMYTGIMPSGSRFKTIADVSREWDYLDQLVERMISQDPGNRPSSIAKVLLEGEALRNIWVSEQNQKELTSRVELDLDPDVADDPLVKNPIEVIGTNGISDSIDFELSNAPNEIWKGQFYNSGYEDAILDVVPQRWIIVGRSASISVGSNHAGIAARFLKRHVERTNQLYVKEVRKLAKRKQQQDLNAAEERLRKEQAQAQALKEIEKALR